MQFVVIGIDGIDDGAAQRRQAMRRQHIDLGEQLRQSGNMWYGAALLHDDGSMKGSMLVLDFPSEDALHEWLKQEPYVTGKVWHEVTIHKSNTRDPWQFNRDQAWFVDRLEGVV